LSLTIIFCAVLLRDWRKQSSREFVWLGVEDIIGDLVQWWHKQHSCHGDSAETVSMTIQHV